MVTRRVGEVPRLHEARIGGEGGGIHALRASPQGEGELGLLRVGIHSGRESGHPGKSVALFPGTNPHTLIQPPHTEPTPPPSAP